MTRVARPRRFRAIALAAASFATAALVPAGRAEACAGCRNPNMPITRLEAVHLAPGEVRVSAVMAATSLHVIHEAGCADLANCNEVPVQPTYMHDQRIYPGELRAIAEAGIVGGFGLELHAPFRIVGTTIKYTTPDGAPNVPLDPDVHHRDETLAGVGDPWLLGRWGTILGGAIFTVRAGLSLPLGRTEPNPFVLGAEGLRHQHIQFGTGTFDPVGGLEIAKAFRTMQLMGYAQAQASLYENSHGFRAGPRFLGGVQAGKRLFGTFLGGAEVDVMHEGPERWDGVIQQDGNLGRTELLLGVSMTQTFGATSVSLTARFPIWRHIVTGDEPQGTLSSPVMLSLVVSRMFGGRI
jgi:hypothetical protein